MELRPPLLPNLPTPSSLSLGLQRGLPVDRNPDEAKLAAKAGSDFEALLVTRLLKTARAAKLGDDLMGKNEPVRDLIDETRARSLTSAAPLGLAQLLAREARH